ncbi:MAG: replicative DNA helicase [Chloroflexota bacterium]|nr:replicative DNA helicase [Chloroflexota bacterium]NOG63122.1 replicative DNA helicase [Chloroflexota bacterium]GIK62934.1 MAG: replicative DNA helicase [Chloroflexota bacterium]
MDEPLLNPEEGLAPHSQEAEEALLGAILINNDALFEVASFLRADDFFFLRNQYVWEAMMRLQERNEVIDSLTLIEELRNQGRLDSIGSGSYITYLLSNSATAMNAEIYGRIVERTATRRRLLKASVEIAQLAKSEDMDVNEVIERAEANLFSVTERRLKREVTIIQDVLAEYYDRIEYLYRTRDKQSGVPTGFIDLDRLLGGLQKSDLLIVAARPGMGKTSFGLNIARNAARAGGRVAVFSLEMSNEQLVQRFIASESGIDSQKLRLGDLDDREWGLFTQSAARLSELPIFLDDTVAITPIQLRTKCRRLKREFDINLVIVDYLQLMNGKQGDRNQNREQEISYISQSLKELARELNLPVLALGQLNRAVEQRADKRPQLSDLRESGCLSGDTLISLADTGEVLPIRALAGRAGFNIWALNPDTLKLEKALVSRAFSTGVKPVYRLTTQLGRTIHATANHKFLTIHGWRRLDELQGGDYLALPRTMPSSDSQTMTDAELALLGHLIGDGCILPGQSIHYTTREIDLAQKVADLALEVFGNKVKPRIQQDHTWYQVYLPTTLKPSRRTRSPIVEWLVELGIWGFRSHEKFVPAKVFQQPTEAIALFLRHLWATDGCIKLVEGKSIRPIAYYASSSERLAIDVQTLLIRNCINARLKRIPQGSKGRDQYHVIVTGKQDMSIFIDRIGAVGQYKTQSLQQIWQHLDAHIANTNRDIIPFDIWRMYVVPSMQASGMTVRQMQSAIDMAHCGTTLYKQNVSRARAARVANVVQSKPLAALAESDVYWDTIQSIELDGEEEVFDLTVPGLHNFVANNIIVHNSIEQNSDVVMFIYRDDVYNENSEAPNQAEIIVAKHRNGPTGMISLYFDKRLTQFRDLMKQSIDLTNY